MFMSAIYYSMFFFTELMCLEIMVFCTYESLPEEKRTEILTISTGLLAIWLEHLTSGQEGMSLT